MLKAFQLEQPGDEGAVEEQGVGAGSTEEPLTSETTKWRQSKVGLRRTLEEYEEISRTLAWETL